MEKKQRVLVVTKDKGTFNVAKPTVAELVKRGHTVHVVAEGLSADLWKKAGQELAFEGTVNFQKEPYEVDIDGRLAKLAPTIVVATGSVPANLEPRFAQATVQARIPLVALEDAIGAAKRLRVTPTKILTLGILAEHFYRERGKLPNTVPLVGLGSDYFRRLELNGAKQGEVDELRKKYDLLVLYAGQGRPMTRDILQLTLECIRHSDPNRKVGLIVRHHPKYPGPNDDLKGELERMLAKFEEERPGTITNPSLNSEEAASVCDFTFTTNGSAVNIAAVHGRVPVCVLTPACIQELIAQTGFDASPLAAMGCAVPLVEATSLQKLEARRPQLLAAQKIYARPEPFRPDQAAIEIERTV